MNKDNVVPSNYFNLVHIISIIIKLLFIVTFVNIIFLFTEIV